MVNQLPWRLCCDRGSFVKRMFIFILWISICSIAPVQAQEQQDFPPQQDWINILEPAENSEVIAKKPEVRVEFAEAMVLDSLVVIVDGTDVTELLTITENGFDYKPIMVLPAGTHSISISATDNEGRQLRKDVTFYTRHSKALEEVYATNEASVIYESVLEKPKEDNYTPYSQLEGNLTSDLKVKEHEHEYTFNTNVRFLDQSMPVSSPQKKGFDVASWLFTASYTTDTGKLMANIGDVQVNETEFTVASLSRRGGVFNIQQNNLHMNFFSLMSKQVFGFDGGTGIDFDTDDHILGFSLGTPLFNDKVQVKTVYAEGGEQGSSYGISTTSGKQKGRVIGLILSSDLLDNKLKTDFEAGFTRYDPDTSDEFGDHTDEAYRVKVHGFFNRYSYEAVYEYIGRDYDVIGNQFLQKDKEGVSFMNSLNLDVHTLSVMLSRYNDNVRGDDLFPRIVNYYGSMDYSFNKFPKLPMGISYQKSIQESTKEPSGAYELDLHNDMISGRINYIKDRMNLGFMTSYSLMNDKTETNNDTTNITYTLTSSYNIPNISVSPSFSLNQSKIHITDVRTDTYLVNLDVRSNFFKKRLFCDVGSSYNVTKANDDSIDNWNLNTNFRIAYNLKDFMKGYADPTIALRGSYMKFTDKAYSGADNEEFRLLLVLATSIPFSF